tara:strand:+ start:1346 stop:2515 length:1170 start_codon:yes stop_codon:yes gene_type:complete
MSAALDLVDLERRARTFAMGAAGAVHGAVDEDASARRALDLLAEKDLLRWTVPPAQGGHDTHDLAADDTVSVRALCAVRRGLAYGSGMLDVMFVEQGLGAFPIVLGGSPKLQSSVLPEVARGTRVSAFALTEVGAGSSVNEVALSAAATDDGWRLNGAKTFISNAGLAAFYTVLVRTGGEVGEREGLTMVYVPADARGIEVKRFEVMAPHPIGEVHFHDVNVAREHLLGEEGQGLDLALGTLARFRTSVAAAATGFARRALDESMAHLDGRRQFGKPLSAFQGLRFDLAEMDTRVRASELLVDEAAELVDTGGDATAAVARAKMYATETASFVCDRAVQHLGGLGVKRGTVVERLFREVRALRIYEGTTEIQRVILAKDILRTHRERNS